ncbi:hypothetical protein LJB88_05120, partial [Erysipelotrichaceae bacterium OttesenSCG-928-M19]|nr:hypothetical protein [Erysipelotrichaceae bacterium OttesenSCG-928-M19]
MFERTQKKKGLIEMYNSKVISKFNGNINGVSFSDEWIFNSTLWFLDLVSGVDEKIICKELIEEYCLALEKKYYKDEYFQLSIFENEIYDNFDNQDYKVNDNYFDKVNDILSKLNKEIIKIEHLTSLALKLIEQNCNIINKKNNSDDYY